MAVDRPDGRDVRVSVAPPDAVLPIPVGARVGLAGSSPTRLGQTPFRVVEGQRWEAKHGLACRRMVRDNRSREE
jgi:hypothetical protein